MKGLLTLDNNFEELQKLIDLVNQFAESCPLNSYEIKTLNLALEEFVTNVIKYAHGPGAECPIHVRYDCRPDRLSVEIEDSGHEFNPLKAEPPPLEHSIEKLKVGGLGIYLVRQLIREIDYQRRDGKNILTITITPGTIRPGKKACCSDQQSG